MISAVNFVLDVFYFDLGGQDIVIDLIEHFGPSHATSGAA